MRNKKVLYISASIGLGHVNKDLAIANELRKQNPGAEVKWLAANPARDALEKKGQRLLPDAKRFGCCTLSAESASAGSRLNLFKYFLSVQKAWIQNVMVIKQVLKRDRSDIVIADEAYELMIALIFRLARIEVPFVIIYDFLGLDSMTSNPLEKIGIYFLNLIWSQDYRVLSRSKRIGLFIGEEEDVPDNRFGFLLPNRREYAMRHYKFLGYIILFNPNEYADQARLRPQLGYGEEPIVICSVGGTTIGRKLLELCSQAYSLVKEKIPDLRMVLVCGPRLSPEDFEVPVGVDVRGYIPDLYQHYAACDLAIVQGGHSSTIELTVLRKPFIFFPIEGHSEQEAVARRVARHKAGVQMSLSETTSSLLAEQIIIYLGKKPNSSPVPTEGAKRAAQLINQIL